MNYNGESSVVLTGEECVGLGLVTENDLEKDLENWENAADESEHHSDAEDMDINDINRLMVGLQSGVDKATQTNSEIDLFHKDYKNPLRPAKEIFHVDPNNGHAGDTVLVTGRGFEPGEDVFFGLVRSGDVHFVSSTRLDVKVPLQPQTKTAVVDLIPSKNIQGSHYSKQFSYASDKKRRMR
jgi:hypothetical protein